MHRAQRKMHVLWILQPALVFFHQRTVVKENTDYEM